MDVRHNAEAHRFELALGESLAVFEYRRVGDTVVATHTEVPPALRGRGIAEVLTRAALAWVEAEKLKIDPQCSYVAVFLDRHPEFAHLR